MVRTRGFVIACLALVCSAGTVLALDSVQLGTPFQVNTTMTGQSGYLQAGDHGVGMADNGDFVVGYFRLDGNSGGVWKRAFNADGTAKDPLDVAVNTTVAGEQSAISVGVRKDGTYDFAWHSYGQDVAGCGSVVMRGFNADGSQRYGEVSIMPAVPDSDINYPDPGWWNNWPGNERLFPSVAVYNNADADDGAMVVTTDAQHSVYPGKLAKDGSIIFSENPLFDNGVTQTTRIQNLGWNAHYGMKAVAVMDNGDAVVLSGDGHHETANDKRARYVVFDRSAGTNGEFAPVSLWSEGLSAQTLGTAGGKIMGLPEEWRCDVAMNGTGQGVMTWVVLEGNFTTGQTDIVARRFTLADVEGVATLTFDDASEWIINEVATDDQFQPQVAMDDDGQFVVVWKDTDKNLYGRAFDSDGTGLPQFQINPDIVGTDTYYSPQVAVDKDAQGNMDFVISYAYNPNVALDAEDNHVLAVLGSALSAAAQVMGDLDHDGDVDIFDWAIFQPMYGFGTGGEPVPEPVTLILLAAGSATMILRRRRS